MKYGKSQINNNTTLTSLKLDQIGVLAASEYTLHVHSNSIQVNSPLAYLHQENASSSANVAEIVNAGTGNALEVTQNGNQIALRIYDNGDRGAIYAANLTTPLYLTLICLMLLQQETH